MQNLPTREQRALRALRNANSRARKHMANNNPTLAIKAMRSGASTAERWLDGTHSQIHLAASPEGD